MLDVRIVQYRFVSLLIQFSAIVFISVFVSMFTLLFAVERQSLPMFSPCIPLVLVAHYLRDIVIRYS